MQLSFVCGVVVVGVVQLFQFLAAIMRKGFCNLSSSSFMARSVSMTRLSQVVFVGFCMLYWSPKSSSFCSSSVKCMSARLMVRG
jgi:hypothetical protein